MLAATALLLTPLACPARAVERAIPALPSFDPAIMRRTIADLSAPEMMGRAPLSEGSRLAQDYIISRFQEYGVAPMGENGGYLQPVRSRLLGRHIGDNVVGVIPGAVKPDEFVYVDAHYDHWGRAGGRLQPGANDNGSGVALLLELARELSRDRPERSVVFFAPDNEEGALLPMLGGLKGARYHAKSRLMPKTVKAALVLDTMGGAFVPGLAPSLYMMGSESSRELQGVVSGMNGPPVRRLGVYAIEPLGALAPRADYAAYRSAKIPFLFATSGVPREYHSADDTVDKIDFGFMREAGSALLAVVRRLASADFAPAFVSGTRAVDWNAELDAVDGVSRRLEALTTLSPRQKAHAARISRLVADARLTGTVRRAVTKSVVSLMRLAGALRFWEHIFRSHGASR